MGLAPTAVDHFAESASTLREQIIKYTPKGRLYSI